MISFRPSGSQVLFFAFCFGLLSLGQSWNWLAAYSGETTPHQIANPKYWPPVPVGFQDAVEVTLLAEAEAQLRDGDSNLRSLDTDAQLLVRNSAPGQSSQAFLRFDFSGAAVQITAASLEIYPTTVWATGAFVNQISVVPNSIWNTKSISPDGVVASSPILDSWSPAAGEPVVIDVTSQIQAAISKGADLTFMIRSPSDNGLLGWVYYGARNSTADFRPQLKISTVRRLYDQAPGTPDWDSLHWSNGTARPITRTGDENDSGGWSKQRGIGSLAVDGDGNLTMRGEQPRIYIDGLPQQFWKNVEITVYYKRIEDSGIPWAGIVIGARSDPDGHTQLEACTSTTYYGRLRLDGKVDFYKELKFPQGEARARTEAWGGDVLPYGRWVGVKFVVYNIENDSAVKLELYRDLAEGVQGGDWEKLGEYTDAGSWGDADSCPYKSDHIITEGGGTVFIRNSGVANAQYKWFTVREIIPPTD